MGSDPSWIQCQAGECPEASFAMASHRGCELKETPLDVSSQSSCALPGAIRDDDCKRSAFVSLEGIGDRHRHAHVKLCGLEP